jgi:hypothetical protein
LLLTFPQQLAQLIFDALGRLRIIFEAQNVELGRLETGSHSGNRQHSVPIRAGRYDGCD